MEKKTIGSFIAALRKANGLTQKELAEKLNVSDKAVSRWERDECYPDMTMIPALAEIFGVSCDELLNGGRINSVERHPRQEQKTAKQIDYLINRVRASFAVHSAGIYALSALGLLAALVCNTVFNRAYLGFFLACVFYVGGLMWLTMKLIASFSALVYETESPLLDRVKEKIVRGAAGNLTGVLIMFAAALPLIVVVNSPYYGLDISDWARYGLVFAGIAAVIGLMICAAVPRICTARGVHDQADGGLDDVYRDERLVHQCLALPCHAQLVAGYNLYAHKLVFDPREAHAGYVFVALNICAYHAAVRRFYAMGVLLAPLPRIICRSVVFHRSCGSVIVPVRVLLRLHECDEVIDVVKRGGVGKKPGVVVQRYLHRRGHD